MALVRRFGAGLAAAYDRVMTYLLAPHNELTEDERRELTTW